ncbi:hypothetical protein VOLCADRAFT_105885 [Volvox carteri f. nagariensis]|uniref:Methyltransferase domain-containing protein n=1 Tax=Volvox carteri f. nagariensis TaxID=3068 RepID=D8U3W4_VOLCA|nr:uncharacterized protein VOLCADRAFT_105885 [Volvox carteri f. nagariensis]EFJ45600.1 hypothetical protein VOLCADRAFT_105885 [Volvox carteri f. nagariensis]|eukprot:XP_002953290.1 hypothetical protein VOLCADRAFT_105885 [Volvox carteri f. nagariensis]
MNNFSVGDIVDVRNYGRAEVIEPLVTEPGSRFYGRIRIKYQIDGKTYYARPTNLRKTVQVKQRVLLCHSTTHYRTCAASVVNWDDAVLEVGSHEGECTWLLSRRCRYIVGVDKSPTTVAAARRRYPGLRFEEVDGFDVPTLKALGPQDGSGFSVVLVDIGGIASLSTVAALVGLYFKEFPYNTKIVVKSVFLKRMVESCLPYNTEKHNPWALLPAGGTAGASSGTAGGDGNSACPGASTQGQGWGEEWPEEQQQKGEEGLEKGECVDDVEKGKLAEVSCSRQRRRNRGESGAGLAAVADHVGENGLGRDLGNWKEKSLGGLGEDGRVGAGLDKGTTENLSGSRKAAIGAGDGEAGEGRGIEDGPKGTTGVSSSRSAAGEGAAV